MSKTEKLNRYQTLSILDRLLPRKPRPRELSKEAQLELFHLCREYKTRKY